MPSRTLKYYFLIPIAVGITAGLGFLYWKFDPADTSNVYPHCPFKLLTGYKCPGCGSQRAVHQLLHLNFKEAFELNQLLVLSLPYIALGFAFEKMSLNPFLLQWRQRLFGVMAIRIVLAIVVAFWIGRNLI